MIDPKKIIGVVALLAILFNLKAPLDSHNLISE